MALGKAVFVVNIGTRKVEAKKVNINGSDDPFYRYKVPQLLVQVVGKGKMIKTMLLNNDDVGKALHVMPEYIPAYMGYEIGSQFKYEKGKPERERASISGEYTSQELSNVMEKFIREVVICGGCGGPELNMAVVKKQIWCTCAGCGNRFQFLKANQKFIKYIQNHPPVGVSTVKKGKQPENKAERPTADKDRPSGEGRAANGADAAGGSDGDGAAAGGAQDAEEGTNPDVEFTEEDLARTEEDLKRVAEKGVEWESETSAEALEQRRAELVPESVKKLVVGGESAETGAMRLKSLADDGAGDAKISIELERLRASRTISDADSVGALFAYLYSTPAAKAIKEHQKLIKQLLHTENTQKEFLYQLEEHLDETNEFKKAASVVKAFYDADLIEEDAILGWHKSAVRSQRVRKAAAPLITWLEEAEEESD